MGRAWQNCRMDCQPAKDRTKFLIAGAAESTQPPSDFFEVILKHGRLRIVKAEVVHSCVRSRALFGHRRQSRFATGADLVLIDAQHMG
ncbi:hypothetical protein BG58_07460 [Caballeronia jiangsuensis]|nr:hypothetical protein BG58_07460 [Caballeronia jiangsuensis]